MSRTICAPALPVSSFRLQNPRACARGRGAVHARGRKRVWGGQGPCGALQGQWRGGGGAPRCPPASSTSLLRPLCSPPRSLSVSCLPLVGAGRRALAACRRRSAGSSLAGATVALFPPRHSLPTHVPTCLWRTLRAHYRYMQERGSGMGAVTCVSEGVVDHGVRPLQQIFRPRRQELHAPDPTPHKVHLASCPLGCCIVGFYGGGASQGKHSRRSLMGCCIQAKAASG